MPVDEHGVDLDCVERDLRDEHEEEDQAEDDPDFIVVAPGTRQAIIMPLKAGDAQVLGVLLVEGDGTPELTSDDFGLLELLADHEIGGGSPPRGKAG